MKVILNYVNMSDGSTTQYDLMFDSIIKLMAFVNEKHDSATSYQVIFLNAAKKD